MKIDSPQFFEEQQKDTLGVPSDSPVRTTWAWLLATAFNVGYIRPGSGTWASAVTLAVWWAIGLAVPADFRLALTLVLSFLILWVGTLSASIVERQSGIKDPGYIVIDEVAGQMIAMIACPLKWKYLIVSFILFRGFDILKPPPLRALEKLPRGHGIMLDDVGAGIYALIFLNLAIRLGL